MTRLILISSGRVPTSVMTLSIKLLLDVVELEQQRLDPWYIQARCIVGGVIVQLGDPLLTLDKVLLVVQVAVVRRNPIVTPHVFGLGHFLAGNQRLVEFFAMASTDNLDLVALAEQLLERFGQVTDSRGRGFLDEQITLLAVL